MKAFSTALSLLVLSASGCSKDSGASTDMGLGGKQLAELTPSERAAFCVTNRDTFAALAVGSCVLSGLQTAPTKDDCDRFRSECQMPGANDALCQQSDAAPPDFSDCGTLTVAPVESCLASAKTYFANLSCSSYGQQPPPAPSCLATIEESCPALLTPFQ